MFCKLYFRIIPFGSKKANPMSLHAAVFHIKLPALIWLYSCNGKGSGIFIFRILNKLLFVYDFGLF